MVTFWLISTSESASLGLNFLEKEGKNGTKLVLRLAFAPKN